MYRTKASSINLNTYTFLYERIANEIWKGNGLEDEKKYGGLRR